MFGKKDPAGDDVFLRLDTANDPLTGTLETESLRPGGNDFSGDIGTLSPSLKRYRRIRAGLGVFVRQQNPGTILEPANNHGGLIAGTQGSASGVNIHDLGGSTPLPAVACIGNTASIGTGTATLRSNRGGSVAFGSAYVYGSGNCTVESTGYASTVIGYAYGAGTARLAATRPGSACIGYANARAGSSFAYTLSTGSGSVCFGLSRSQNGNGTALLQSTASGSFASGMALSASSSNATVEAIADGSFAQGFASGTVIGPAVIRAAGQGAFAQGSAIGNESIIASATNSVQFGPGSNSLANSLQVGNAGLRLIGVTGTPATPQNGDFWVNNGFVYVRSNNVSIQIAGPGPLTN